MQRNAHQEALAQWCSRLEQPQNARQRAIGAVMPNLELWAGREGDRVTYRLMEILTAHGWFAEYQLHNVGSETAQCHHCAADLDSVQNTLEAWASERVDLISQFGRDLSPPAISATMLAGEEGWGVMVSFCEAVMLAMQLLNEIGRRPIPSADDVGGDTSRRQGYKLLESENIW